jgi:uncharacterized DUF497 family protein
MPKMYGLEFEWDQEKADYNYHKHGVSFEEATEVFGDPLSKTIIDSLHSSPDEARLIITGMSNNYQLILIVHCETGDIIRIISARRANKMEKRNYEEGI